MESLTKCSCRWEFPHYNLPPQRDVLHLWIPSWKVEDCRDGCWESSVSSLRSKLFFCCLLNGSVDGTHFFLGQSPLHVTVRDTVTVAHSLCSRRVWKEKKIIWQQSSIHETYLQKCSLKVFWSHTLIVHHTVLCDEQHWSCCCCSTLKLDLCVSELWTQGPDQSDSWTSHSDQFYELHNLLKRFDSNHQ